MSPSRFPTSLVLALALTACSDPTALDLSLIPDPNVQSESALVTRLVRLRLVVDAPEGLYPAGPSRTEGDLELVDLDGDGARELTGRVELGALGRLPLVRLERGGMPARPAGIELRIDGLGPDDSDGKQTADAELAAGGVQGIAFSEAVIAPVQIPFNLRAKFRPPRVTQVFPDADATFPPGSVASVLVIFSKAMNPSSLKPGEVLQALLVEGSVETPIPLKEIVVGELHAGGPTTVVLRFVDPLRVGRYHVRVGQGALDTSGRPLDQIPMQPGNQPFSSHFTVSGPETAIATECQLPSCEPACGSCPAGSACQPVSGTCWPQSCPKACSSGWVCDTARALCVEDCRLFGSYDPCREGKTRCDSGSGLCR